MPDTVDHNTSRQRRWNHLRQHLSKESFPRYSATQSWVVALSYPLQIVGVVSVGFWMWRETGYGWLFALAAFVISATRFRGINNIIHECCHFTFAHNKATNYSIGRLCAALTFFSFQDYRDSHMTHHVHLGDSERDEDFRLRQRFGFGEQLTAQRILKHICTPLLLRHFPDYFAFRLVHEKSDGAAYTFFKLAYLAVIFALLAVYPVETMIFFVAPFVLGFTAINYWTDCVDHAGLITDVDPLLQSRNAKVPKLLRPLLFPRNDSFHLVHHLFPAVPARHYPLCHRLLLEDVDYRSVHAIHVRDKSARTASQERSLGCSAGAGIER